MSDDSGAFTVTISILKMTTTGYSWFEIGSNFAIVMSYQIGSLQHIDGHSILQRKIIGSFQTKRYMYM